MVTLFRIFQDGYTEIHFQFTNGNFLGAQFKNAGKTRSYAIAASDTANLIHIP